MHSLITLSENYSIINERPSLVLCIKCLLFKLISYNIKILMYKIRSYFFCFFFFSEPKNKLTKEVEKSFQDIESMLEGLQDL